MIRILVLIIFGFLFVFTGRFLQAQSPTDLVEQCANEASENATYLKDFVVKLAEAKPGSKHPIARYPLILSKNNVYRFSVCTTEQSEGKAVIRLYDSNHLIFSSYDEDTQEEFNPFNFLCRKTGIYHVFISFIDGKPGEAVGILSYVTK
ncbi:MAG: hypothetical protein AMS23_10400 [Bacteroides sp. SM1_62]|nr:MAG: hypothetical protein AMS26_24155 [Bacteroides sp. SM23_62]KPL20770.1 MAG: hypothetical protein AMS23_10400 [Bacteroides sp. SM1_62]